jgi:UDP-N-acetylglucosamine acyltransferase
MSRIHPTALVDPGAELDSTVEVGPYTVIGPGVRIGAGTRVGSHCLLEGPTTIGCDNRIFGHSAIGGEPQDMKYRGEPTSLVIGDRNTIREYCTFNRGTTQDAGVTRLGDDNWVMAYVHLAHDVQVGNRVILANNATLAGHVHVGDWVIIGGLTGVHQFCHVGAHAITGFQSHVSQDVPPYMTVSGNPLSVHGINLEGLRRRGFSRERIAGVKQMHRLLYREGLTLERAREALSGLAPASSPQAEAEPAAADVQLMLDFLSASTRGIVR